MLQRSLGRGGPSVSAIGLGCMGMSPGVYGPATEADSIRAIHRALELGITLLDTAEIYGAGHNEKLVGKAIAERREQVFLATKFGIRRAAGSSGYEHLQADGRPEAVKQALDGSLQRLGVDHVDLYYQHRIDLTVPVEETIGAMAELVKAGKVRYLGISEASAETIRRAHAVHPLAAMQSEFSLWSRDIQDNSVTATLHELGIALVAYSPLGRGFLSGELHSRDALSADDFRRTLPRFSADNFTSNLEIVTRVRALAQAKDVTPAQIALAWVLAQDSMVIPIPGTTKAARVEQNAAAVYLELSAAELAQLDAVVNVTRGERYPQMSWVNR